MVVHIINYVNISISSERMGWVPVGDEIPGSLKEEYKWIEGLSVTEMEIMHAAYRNDNPNCKYILPLYDPCIWKEIIKMP